MRRNLSLTRIALSVTLLSGCGEVGVLLGTFGGGSSPGAAGEGTSPAGAAGTTSTGGGATTGGSQAGSGGMPATAGTTSGSAGEINEPLDSGMDGGCTPSAMPAHRYSFDTAGTDVLDSIGDAHGVLTGTTLDGSGSMVLTAIPQYVTLPPDIIEGLQDVSVMIWFRWDQRTAYHRIFDFGSSSLGAAPAWEDGNGLGLTYFALSPRWDRSNIPSNTTVLLQTTAEDGEWKLGSEIETFEAEHMITVVVQSGNSVSLYGDGVIEARSATPTLSLAEIDYQNAWIGRSQYNAKDGTVVGTFREFRIYDFALTDCDVNAAYVAGPDVLP